MGPRQRCSAHSGNGSFRFVIRDVTSHHSENIYIVPRSFGDIITGGHLVYGLSFHQITQSCWEMRMLSWNRGLVRQRLNSSIFYLGVSEKSEKYMTIQTLEYRSKLKIFILFDDSTTQRLDERRGHYSNWNWQQIMESKDFTEEEELWQSWWRLRAKVNIMVGPRTMRQQTGLGWVNLMMSWLLSPSNVHSRHNLYWKDSILRHNIHQMSEFWNTGRFQHDF